MQFWDYVGNDTTSSSLECVGVRNQQLYIIFNYILPFTDGRCFVVFSVAVATFFDDCFTFFNYALVNAWTLSGSFVSKWTTSIFLHLMICTYSPCILVNVRGKMVNCMSNPILLGTNTVIKSVDDFVRLYNICCFPVLQYESMRGEWLINAFTLVNCLLMSYLFKLSFPQININEIWQ